MKRRILSVAFLLLPLGAFASPYPDIRMDARIELVSALALLAGADSTASGFYEYPSPYARRLRRELAPHQKDPAVSALDARLRAGLTSLDLYQIALRLSPTPPYALVEQLPQPIVDRLGGTQAAEDFLTALSHFAEEADFPGFWRRSEQERQSLMAPAKAAAEKSTAQAVLEKYTGLPALPHTVILSPEAEPVFALTTYVGENGMLSVFGPERYKRDWLFRRIFKFNIAGRRNDLWRQDLQAQLARAPGADAEVVREAAAAATARLLKLQGAHEMAELTLVKYARVGMPHLRALFHRLEAYESARERYPTILDFYPELLRAYVTDDSRSDFSGGLETLWRSPDAVTIIAPGGAEGPWAAAALAQWPQAQILSPKQAAAKDFTGRHLVAVGTLEQNAWLKTNWDALRLPLRLSVEGVSWARADRDARSYELKGRLGLITVARHPTDRLRGTLVVTAAQPSALPRLEFRPASGLDFLLLDGERVAKAGLYEKSLLPWRPR